MLTVDDECDDLLMNARPSQCFAAVAFSDYWQAAILDRQSLSVIAADRTVAIGHR